MAHEKGSGFNIGAVTMFSTSLAFMQCVSARAGTTAF